MDFQQGLITTVHDYSLGNLDRLAFRKELSQKRTSILIPCLMEEFSRPALGLIRESLAELDGLTSLVGADGSTMQLAVNVQENTLSFEIENEGVICIFPFVSGN